MPNNNLKKVLCFIDGETYLYDKEVKTYIPFTISVDEAMQIIKANIILTPNIRPKMKDVWNTLAKNLDGCDGFSSYFSKKNKINSESFENILTQKITKFLDYSYPPEIREEQLRKKKEYEENMRKKQYTSISARKKAKEKLMTIKSGKKIY